MYVSKCARENVKEREKGIVVYILPLPSERKSKGNCVLLTCRNYSPIKIAPTSL